MKKEYQRTCYALLIKDSNGLYISLTKNKIADILNLSPATIARKLRRVNIYDSSLYTIWKDIPLLYIKRGFRLRQRGRYSSY